MALRSLTDSPLRHHPAKLSVCFQLPTVTASSSRFCLRKQYIVITSYAL